MNDPNWHQSLVKQFYATGLFPYPLHTSETRGFLMLPEGLEKDKWHEEENGEVTGA